MDSSAPVRPLSIREARFCELYVQLGIAGAAAERAGYSPRRAYQTGHELLQRAEVQARIAELRAAVAEQAKVDTADLLRHFWTLATADARELVEYRRTCCRHCWGLHHDYQRTSREIYEAVREYAIAQSEKRRGIPAVFSFGHGDGGPGWDPEREPNPDCPECFGRGDERTYIHDTRLLSPAARLLYAGVKQTKDGLEVKMHSQFDAADRVGRILGAYKETVETRNLTLEDLIKEAAEEAADSGDATVPHDPDRAYAAAHAE